MNAHALSLKYLIKRVLKEFAGKPVYTIVTVIVLSVLTAATMLLTTLASYSSERVIASALTEGQTAMVYQYIKDDPVGYGADGTSIYARLIKDDDIDGLRLYYDDNSADGTTIYGIIDSADELLSLGYEFDGEYRQLEGENDFYYTDYALAAYGYEDVKAGDEIVWTEDGSYTTTVKGIIKTDYKNYIKFKKDKVSSDDWTIYTPHVSGNLSEREQAIGEYNLKYVYPLKFGNKSMWHDFGNVSLNWYETYTYVSDEGSKTFTLNPYGLKLTSGNYTGAVNDGSILYFNGATNYYVFTENGLIKPQESTVTDDGEFVQGESVSVGEDEIVISQNLYNTLFNEDFIVAEGVKEREYPEHLGEIISFSLMDGDKAVVTIKDKKLIGISANRLNEESDSFIDIVTTDYAEFMEYSYPVVGKVFKVNGNIESDLTEWRKEGIMFTGNFASVAYDRERSFKQITSFAGLASAILGVLSVLAVVSFVSLRIRESKKEIGIMRAVGVSRKELYFIFLGGTLLSSIIALVVANIGIFVTVPLLNAAYADALFPELSFISFTFLSELSGIAAGLILPLICAVIPTARIISRPPVKLLRA